MEHGMEKRGIDFLLVEHSCCDDVEAKVLELERGKKLADEGTVVLRQSPRSTPEQTQYTRLSWAHLPPFGEWLNGTSNMPPQPQLGALPFFSLGSPWALIFS